MWGGGPGFHTSERNIVTTILVHSDHVREREDDGQSLGCSSIGVCTFVGEKDSSSRPICGVFRE